MIFATHELADGSRVRLRLTRPTDAGRIQEFFEGSPDAVVREFTFYDLHRRLMMAATEFSAAGEQIVGLADLTFHRGGLAEVAVLVREDARGQGVGTLLAEAVASVAVRRGVTRLKSELPMLERLGPTVRTVEDGRSVRYTRLSRAPRWRRAA